MLRIKAARILCKIGPAASDSLPSIGRLIQQDLNNGVSNDDTDAWGIITELSNIGPSSIPLLTKLTAHQHNGGRACTELAELGQEAIVAIPTLKAQLENPEAHHRPSALSAIVAIHGYSSEGNRIALDTPRKKHNSPELRALLLAALLDDDVHVVRAAVSAISHMKEDARKMLPEVIKRIGQIPPQVTASLLAAIAQADPAAVETASEAAAHHLANQLPNHEARTALIQLGEVAVSPALLAKLNDKDSNSRNSALGIVLQFAGTTKGRAALVQVLGHDDPEFYVAGRNALLAHGVKGPGFELLLTGIQNPNDDIAIGCMKAIPYTLDPMRTRPADLPAALTRVKAALKIRRNDSKPHIRKAAMRVTEQIGLQP